MKIEKKEWKRWIIARWCFFMCWSSCHPALRAMFQMRPGGPSLCCWVCEVGLQQLIWAHSNTLCHLLWEFLFQGQIFLPSFIHTDHGFILGELLCWFHWRQLSQWSSTCCQKMKQRGYKLASLIWANNCFFIFSFSYWVAWCILFGMGW